jgi:hypothetical protein
MFTGEPYASAVVSTQKFFKKFYPAEAKLHTGIFEPAQELQHDTIYRMFLMRLSYAYVSSRFWRSAGFSSLLYVSLAAYFGAIVAMYLLASAFAWRSLAVVLAVFFGIEAAPMANAAMTDMPALFLLILSVAAMCLYVRSPGRMLLICYAALTGILALTRPVVYIPISAAIALFAVALLNHEKSRVRSSLLLAAVPVAWTLVLLGVAKLTHAPGFMELMGAERVDWDAHNVDHFRTLADWYSNQLGVATMAWIKYQIRSVWPIAAAIGLLWKIRSVGVPALLGVWVAGFISLVLNPVSDAVIRTVFLPALPAMLCGLGLLVNVRLAPSRATAPAK